MGIERSGLAMKNKKTCQKAKGFTTLLIFRPSSEDLPKTSVLQYFPYKSMAFAFHSYTLNSNGPLPFVISLASQTQENQN